MSVPALQSILKAERSYPKRQIILYQAEDIRNFFVIEKGYVRVYDINSQGEEKVLLLLGPGDIFPIVWSFEKSETHYFYEAMTDCVIKVGKKRDLTESIENNHEVVTSLFKYFIDKTNQLYLRIECLEATNSKFKVIQTMRYLSKFHSKRGKDGYSNVRVPLTHQDIANMTGLTRETVSIQMKNLEDKKVLSQADSTLCINRKLLRAQLSEE